MKRFLLILVLLQLLISCKIEDKFLPKTFSEDKIARTISKVEIETLISDSLLNVRALEVVNDFQGKSVEACMFASSSGKIGMIINFIGVNNLYNENNKFKIDYPIGYINEDLNLNFRSLALTERGAFAISIGSPAYLISLKSGEYSILYKENHPKAFYDSMDFWNDQEGIAIGDPTDDCMSIIITRDGGNTWNKLPCNSLPKAKEGEAAFAASDTNIAIVGNHTWVATGGKSSRVLYSPDKGKTWQVFETPIVQGKETTGMYSIDFYDEIHGFAIGGDYTNPDDNAANKIRTNTGGKTWEVVSDGFGPGYKSCVQYVPNGQAKELVAIGFKGIDYTNDAGKTWKHLSNEGFYTIRFLNDSVAYAAGNGRISKLTFR